MTFVRSSVSKVSHIREIKWEVITTLNIAHLLHFSHHFPDKMAASVPACMTWKNSSIAEIKFLHSQPFKNNHFHFLITVVFVMSPTVASVAHTDNSGLMGQGQNNRVDGAEVPSEMTATTCAWCVLCGVSLAYWMITQWQMSRSLLANSLIQSSKHVMVAGFAHKNWITLCASSRDQVYDTDAIAQQLIPWKASE